MAKYSDPLRLDQLTQINLNVLKEYTKGSRDTIIDKVSPVSVEHLKRAIRSGALEPAGRGLWKLSEEGLSLLKSKGLAGLRTSHACPAVYSKFQKSVNMSSAQIKSWAKDPRAKCGSFQETRDRLTKPQMFLGHRMRSLADLKALPKSKWEEKDCIYAKRVINFNTRHEGALKIHGCTDREHASLLNWGRRIKRCPLPKAGCSTRPPAGKPPKRFHRKNRR